MNKKILKLASYLLMSMSVVLVSSCSSSEDNEIISANTKIADESLVGMKEFQQATASVIQNFADKSFNYNTSSTRAIALEEDTLRELSSSLAKETEVFLVRNNIDVSEIKKSEDGEYRMAYLGMLILDYNKVANAKNITRASLGDCVLKAAGIGDLAVRGLSTKVAMKVLMKVALKRAIPYIGWGLAIGEGAACLAGY